MSNHLVEMPVDHLIKLEDLMPKGPWIQLIKPGSLPLKRLAQEKICPNLGYVDGTDPHGDNYNIDPNGDNYNVSQDSGSEGNGVLDWDDANNNQIWDEEEGEQWFDYGLDQTQDIYEQYLLENQIIVSTSSNCRIISSSPKMKYKMQLESVNGYSDFIAIQA